MVSGGRGLPLEGLLYLGYAVHTNTYAITKQMYAGDLCNKRACAGIFSSEAMSLHHLPIMTQRSLSCLLSLLRALPIPIFPFDLLVSIIFYSVLQGIVVDVPFAPFFLSHMLQHNQSTYCNYLDELASFDQQMYSSLNFIKVHQYAISSGVYTVHNISGKVYLLILN